MRNILQDFRFVPDGATTLVDALCNFLKEEITFNRLKGGEKLPTINEMCKATGLTFAQARRVTECLAREGYVASRPHSGTIVLSRGDNVLRGRVLFIMPNEDVGRYHPSQLIDIVGRKMTAAGYSFSCASSEVRSYDYLAGHQNLGTWTPGEMPTKLLEWAPRSFTVPEPCSGLLLLLGGGLLALRRRRRG